MDIGETALSRGVEVFTLAQARCNGSLDRGLDGAEPIVGLEVSSQGFERVCETETDRGGLVGGFVGDLCDDLVSVDDVGFEMKDDTTVSTSAELPRSGHRCLAVRLHCWLTHYRSNDSALGARYGFSRVGGAAVGH